MQRIKLSLLLSLFYVASVASNITPTGPRMWENTAGPNSVLGNYTLANAFADNYITLSGSTNFNLDEFDQVGTFPSPVPTSWKNMNVRT